ncbi:protein RGF1 INDUCIBLE TRANSCRIPTION FACTOR 1 [Cannabis sativa]|uniref:protein RGF1 INDUCIBLE TRANSCRIPTION FACTOR 1 n=1 Tax=Cannabis sativa TaxID=3483 RepID=UPI0029CA8A6F|nr:protein RGF1 INDUCIBLE TRANSCRIPTION FACTOR 1 [Cannabis sativa]
MMKESSIGNMRVVHAQNFDHHDHHNNKKNNKMMMMMVPRWLIVMYKTIYFSRCIVHPNSKKNDSDHFCIDCLRPLCFNCLPSHFSHKHVKIRRYIYSDVINRQDLSKLFNCSGIQTYHTNKAKVVFLKQRRSSQQGHHVHQLNNNINNNKEYKCIICHRTLQDNSRYCSIACKVLAIHGDHEVKSRRKISCNNNKEKEDQLLITALSFPNKRQNLRRKGVPLRAPFF